MNTYLQVLKKYADFSGRASRKEYWVFALYNIMFIVIAMLLDNILGIAIGTAGYGPLYGLYALATLIPGLAVAVRRLHDVGRSGWMVLIAFIPLIGAIWLLVLLATNSNPGENQYGEESKDIQDDYPVSDEIILAYILWIFLVSAFYGIFPIINQDFYHTLTFEIAQKYIPLIGGILTLSLAFVIRNKSKRILLIVLGGLILLYNIYTIVMQFIK